MMIRRTLHAFLLTAAIPLIFMLPVVWAINGRTPPRLDTFNGWKAFEVISEDDNPTGSWEMPDDFDGAGAWIPDSTGNLLRIIVNHENEDATISEINVDLQKFERAIVNTIVNGTMETIDSDGNVAGIDFVLDAQQAYHRWSSDIGETWKNTTDSSDDTDFSTFCSGQAYEPNTFGVDRGFVDHLYITGEEVDDGRLFALDLVERDIYQLSGAVGSMPNAGNGGMPFDAWENAALVDTRETDHIALLLSPDEGSEDMQLYIGHKRLNKYCSEASSDSKILERNGLACGSYYFLIGDLPDDVNETLHGNFSTSDDDALSSGKLEDVDTFPGDPTKVALGDETSGTFVLDFVFDFDSGSFNANTSTFSITKIVDQESGSDGILNDADNVDWTAATTLGGNEYPNGLIFVNEDDDDGEVWQINPDGTNQILVARANAGSGTSGIFDLSELIGFKPASVLICNNKGDPSSMSVLINPDAELLFEVLPTRWPTALPSASPAASPPPSWSPTMLSTAPSLMPSNSRAPALSSSPSLLPSVVPTTSSSPSTSSIPSVSLSPTTSPSLKLPSPLASSPDGVSSSIGPKHGTVGHLGCCIFGILLLTVLLFE